ncbi:DUF2247 family protein [Cohnella abietis]|uniref:DUF2247 domain-containing protein n=1 Tax=Cohnella abietis TaxID=2507935 RepID=A0A3T1D679_9BACL|nr:DUF2247 family protein [Cohnella abietis]BBI33573.1 hypothetical protein KCTCHS21_29720 [Cohnella abietis]
MGQILHLFNVYNIPVEWLTIYVGRKLGYLQTKEINEYSIQSILDNPNLNDRILDLSWETDELVLEEMLSEVVGGCNETSEEWQLELKKFRYIQLKELEKNAISKELLIRKIAEIYADFGYPQEMEKFIYYMPATDGFNPQAHSSEENLDRLLEFFKEFLLEEASEITI